LLGAITQQASKFDGLDAYIRAILSEGNEAGPVEEIRTLQTCDLHTVIAPVN